MFRSSFQRRRGVLPADGWYEWMTTPNGKVPWYHYPMDGTMCLFPVIWDRWQTDGAYLESCVMLTTEAMIAEKPKKDAPKKERQKKERKERPEAAPSKSVFVGNLPFSIEAAALEAHMSSVGACTADLKKREQSGKPAGFAVVEYESIEVATEAIEKLMDTELEGRKIVVRFDAGK